MVHLVAYSTKVHTVDQLKKGDVNGDFGWGAIVQNTTDSFSLYGLSSKVQTDQIS